jgi:hypothetical protein
VCSLWLSLWAKVEKLCGKEECLASALVLIPLTLGLQRLGVRIFPWSIISTKEKVLSPYAFADEEAKNRGDKEWHQIGLLVDGFNNNHAQNFAASSLKVPDELMSAYCPRITHVGGLPNLEFISLQAGTTQNGT